MTRIQALDEAERLHSMGYDVSAREAPILARGQWEIRCVDGRDGPPGYVYGLREGDATRLCLSGLVKFRKVEA